MWVRKSCVTCGVAVRHRRWLVFATCVGLVFGCSDGSGLTIDASGEELPGAGDDETPGASAIAPLVVAALKPPASGTTPDALDVTLSSNLDSLSIRTKITDQQGVAWSDCEVVDVYRVGPSAVSWPIGGSLTLPLGYAAALPDGSYVHAVSLGIGAFGNRWIQTSVSQLFEVTAGVFRSMADEALPGAIGAGAAPGAAAPGDPCPPLPEYTDEMPLDGATSRIDFDSWQGLGTIQPMRWLGATTRPSVGPLPSLLTFHALLAGRGRLQLDLMTPSDTPADFEATFPDAGRILLDEVVDGSPVTWGTLSGSATVHVDDQGRVRVSLADVVLARSRRGAERSVASGLLVGDVVAEQWP
jgi:hypothetical protein